MYRTVTYLFYYPSIHEVLYSILDRLPWLVLLLCLLLQKQYYLATMWLTRKDAANAKYNKKSTLS